MRHFDLDKIPFPEIPLDVPILSIFFPKAQKGPISYANASVEEISDAIVQKLLEQVKQDMEKVRKQDKPAAAAE